MRRIKSFSKIMDVFNPNQEKLHTINNQRKDLAGWFHFLNISIEMPKIREPPVPDP